MSDLYSNDKVRERAERIVREEVIYCVSALVGDLRRMYHELPFSTQRDLGFDEEDLNNLVETTDWDEPATRHIDDDMDADDLRSYLDDQNFEYVAPVDADDADEDTPATEGSSIEELRTLAYAALREQGAKEFCEEFRIDPDHDEVYEHWIVTGWLKRKLDEKGYTTGELSGLTIWGRGTTGQAISMDHVILSIANDLIEKYGD